MNEWFSLFLNGDYGGAASGFEATCFIMVFSFLVGQCVGWTYMATHRGLSYSQSFVVSIVILPALVALIMVLMAGSLMVAFGLLAVFAVVRFRNVLKDTRDTTYILWAITEGMAIGIQRYSTALIGVVGITAIIGYLHITSFGSRHRFDAVLDFHLSGDLKKLQEGLKYILRRHCTRSLLASQQRIGADSTNLSYRVLLRDPSRGNELCRALENIAEISAVNLFLREDESEI
ncbi:MAG: DUF4956 domain-containing protein [Pirellulales bacterium]|nr:DUF4956 domain-containing protein [Pirellulales bacterium]